MKIVYTPKKFSNAHLALIATANEIIAEYESQSLVLTLRQLYYQFVARDLLPNKQQEYKRLGGILNDARLAGLVSWEAMEDRTRYLRELPHWRSPGQIIESAAYGYRIDKWADQEIRPEVWIEKDALIGVIERVCNDHDVPFFACRGYNSQSEAWSAGRRVLSRFKRTGQSTLVLHFGDHDPSGLDMTVDNRNRLGIFTAGEPCFELRRLALNQDQIDEYNPPPNPAKTTDSRSGAYIAEHGDQSWELDALEPRVLADLIRVEIESVLDRDKWDEAVEREKSGKALLDRLAKEYKNA